MSIDQSKRIRFFERISERLQKVNIDILHKVHQEGALNERWAQPATGALGCLFLDELHECQRLDRSISFRSFYSKILDYVQSLPELIHHKHQVIQLFDSTMNAVASEELSTYFRLLSILYKDLHKELWDHFHFLMTSLIKLIPKVSYTGKEKTSNPELTGQLFECISHLLRSQWSQLCEDPECLRHFYGSTLGSYTFFVRTFAAKSFVLVLRKLSKKLYRLHTKRLINALAVNHSNLRMQQQHEVEDSLIAPDLHVFLQNTSSKRMEEEDVTIHRLLQLYEGTSQLIFFSLKGVKDCMHSKAIERIKILFDHMIQLKVEELKKITNTDDGIELGTWDRPDNAVRINTVGRILSFALVKLFRHVHPSRLDSLWLVILNASKTFCDIFQILQQQQQQQHSFTSYAQDSLGVLQSFIVEILIFSVGYSRFRNLQSRNVRNKVEGPLIEIGLEVCHHCFNMSNVLHSNTALEIQSKLSERGRKLFSLVWGIFPRSSTLIDKLGSLIPAALQIDDNQKIVSDLSKIGIKSSPIVQMLEVFDTVPEENIVHHLLPAMFENIIKLYVMSDMFSLSICLEIFMRWHDIREDYYSTADELSRQKVLNLEYNREKDVIKDEEDSWGEESMHLSDEDQTGSDDDSDIEYHQDSDDSFEVRQKKVQKVTEPETLQTRYSLFQNVSDNHLHPLIQMILKRLDLVLTSYLQSTQKCTNVNQKKSSLKLKKGKTSASIESEDKTVAALDCGLLSAKCTLWCLHMSMESIHRSQELKDLMGDICSQIKQCIDLWHDTQYEYCRSEIMPFAADLLIIYCRWTYTSSLPSTLECMSKMMKILHSNPLSIALTWSLEKCLSFLARQSQIDGINVDDLLLDILKRAALSQEELVSTAGEALASPSHWIRLHWLRLISLLPPLELMQGDRNDGSETKERDRMAENEVRLDIPELCLEIACLEPNVQHEREFIRRLSSLEIIIRTRHLSRGYAKLICGFCFGIINVKFKPIWEPAIQVLVTAAKVVTTEAVLWPFLLQSINLSEIMHQLCIMPVSQQLPWTALSSKDAGHLQVFMSEATTTVFYYHFSAEDNSTLMRLVDPDARTDVETLCSVIWDILRRCPTVTLKRSKAVVGLFIDFLTQMYYQVLNKEPEIPRLHRIGLFDVTAHKEGLERELSQLTVVRIYSSISKSTSSSGTDRDSSQNDLSVRLLRKRMEMFLKVFGEVTGPKQLYCHQLLYLLYHELTGKADSALARLAFECICTFKAKSIVPYKELILSLFDDKKIRDALVNFNPSANASTEEIIVRSQIDRGSKNENDRVTVVDQSHRAELMPLLLKVLYGRMLAKIKGGRSSRDLSIARRNAVIDFIAKTETYEIRHFVQMMMCGVIPIDLMIRCTSDATKSLQTSAVIAETMRFPSYEQFLSVWYDSIDYLINSQLQSQHFALVSLSRITGFLYSMEASVKLLGFGITTQVPLLLRLIVLIINYVNSVREEQQQKLGTGEEDDEDDDAHDDGDDVSVSDSHIKRVSVYQTLVPLRTRSLHRLSEIIDQFHGTTSFDFSRDGVFTALQPLIAALHTSISTSSRPPALLRVFFSLSKYTETYNVLTHNSKVIEQIIRCVAVQKASFVVIQTVIELLNNLLDHDEGKSLVKHADLVITSFCQRFAGKDFSETAELKLSEMKIIPSTTVEQELRLLSRIANAVFSRDITANGSISVHLIMNLGTLLLGMLRTYTATRKVRISEDLVINILCIYELLVPHMLDLQPHLPFISRLFGPASHSHSLLNLNTVRSHLLTAFREVCVHRSIGGSANSSVTAMEALLSEDKSLIGSRDFNRVMPIFQSLSTAAKKDSSDDLSWSSLLGPALSIKVKSSSKETTLVGPRAVGMHAAVVYEAIRCLYDSEVVVRTAAVAALKQLISDCATWAVDDIDWLSVLDAILMPAIRRGLKMSSDVIKKGFINLLSHIVSKMNCEQFTSQSYQAKYHLDLAALQHHDPEQDFFENLIHIQLHRRARALKRVKDGLQLEDNTVDRDGGNSSASSRLALCSSTLVHVLMPLVYHFLFSEEFSKKNHLILLNESVSLFGAIGSHLQWNHYLAATKTLLKQLDRCSADQEKMIINALCALLDSFHFELAGEVPVRSDDIIADAGTVDVNEVQDEERDEGADIFDMNEAEVSSSTGKNIVQSLLKVILPWLQTFLLKDGVDHKGNKTKTVQPQIALAITNLIKKIEPPVVTAAYKQQLFVNLVMRVVGTLKSRDTSCRDVARSCLGQMVIVMGISSMHTVFFEMQHLLSEGYQRHIRNYTMRSILSSILDKYAPPADARSIPIDVYMQLASVNGSLADQPEFQELKDNIIIPDFDKSIPLIVECALDDLVGIAKEDREATDGVQRSLIREAKGSKANDILEITARCLLFRPTYALIAVEETSSVSSIHALTSPFMQLLHDVRYQHQTELVGRVAEALQRVAHGLSKNVSLNAKELLLYLHSTLHPFISEMKATEQLQRTARGMLLNKKGNISAAESFGQNTPITDGMEANGIDISHPSYLREDSSDEDEKALYSKPDAAAETKNNDVMGYRAKSWLPSHRHMQHNEQKAVIAERDRASKQKFLVQDGASAPKLTGQFRYDKVQHLRGSLPSEKEMKVAHRSCLVAVRFCLTLFCSCLKAEKLSCHDLEVQSMALPFLPLLSYCMSIASNANVVTLAIRCLSLLLDWGIATTHKFRVTFSGQLLKQLFAGSGALVTTETELAQSSIRGLTALFKNYNQHRADDRRNQTEEMSSSQSGKKRKECGIESESTAANEQQSEELDEKQKLPVEQKMLRNLLQMLTVSILEITANFQTAAFQLIREIVHARVMLPEVYDLINKLAEQVVLSQRKGVREASSSIITTFLLTYPLGEKRVASQLKQLINNCSYQFEEGRASALNVMLSVVKKVAVVVLEEYSQMIFLPITLRVVNDSSALCREVAAAVIVALLRRVGIEAFQNIHEFILRWIPKPQQDLLNSDPNAQSIARTGMQVASLAAKARPELIKRGKHIITYITAVHHALNVLLPQFVANRRSLEERELAKFAEGRGSSYEGADSTWALVYHLMSLIEQLFSNIPQATDYEMTHLPLLPSLMELIQEAMLFPHAWVRAASVRVLHMYLKRRDPTVAYKLRAFDDGIEFLEETNGLFHLARRLCVLLNQSFLSSNTLDTIISNLVFAIQAIVNNRHLLQTEVKVASELDVDTLNEDGDEDEINNSMKFARSEAELEAEEQNEKDALENLLDDLAEPVIEETNNLSMKRRKSMNKRNSDADQNEIYSKDSFPGAHWVMQRLRGIGADSRGNRRVHVMKLFMMLIKSMPVPFLKLYLEQIVDVTVRATLSNAAAGTTNATAHDLQLRTASTTGSVLWDTQQMKDLATELMTALEQKTGSSSFIEAFATVQRRVQTSKALKKRQLAAEAIAEPVEYAKKKLAHSRSKRIAKSKQNLRHAAIRGLGHREPVVKGAKKQKR